MERKKLKKKNKRKKGDTERGNTEGMERNSENGKRESSRWEKVN
jgi:hypothetical protein